MIESAPAAANSSTRRSGRSTIRCTSSTPPRSCTWSRSASTISAPIEIGGTKWPSITSTWITRAPASITCLDLLAEPGEVGGEDRGRHADLSLQERTLTRAATLPRAAAPLRGDPSGQPSSSSSAGSSVRFSLLVLDLVERGDRPCASRARSRRRSGRTGRRAPGRLPSPQWTMSRSPSRTRKRSSPARRR